ncbi:MAG: glycogen synthase [Candidatus Omnitrophota bacterium]
MKVLFCSSEIVPFAKTGGLADVAGALPASLKQQGVDVVLAMPEYRGIEIACGDRLSPDLSCSLTPQGIRIYFIRNDRYFKREGLYGDGRGDYPDNLERFAFYCRGALSAIKQTGFRPDIIHCNEWQTGLIPVFLNRVLARDPFYKDIKTVLSLHNLAYQGVFPLSDFEKLRIDYRLSDSRGLEIYGKINLLKAGIELCDAVNTVSPTYAREILTPEFGCGLEGVLAKRKHVFGILNGLDYEIWDSLRDKFVFKRYSVDSAEDKAVNKSGLQKEAGLPVSSHVPLLGMVARLAEQKGLELLCSVLEDISPDEAQIVVLGTGEERYHRLLAASQDRHPRLLRAYLKFDEGLAHKIYAGADLFLMPSRYEPCGLGQMISLKYGTIPLVFRTGGLADTVSAQNGFVFETYDKEHLLAAIRRATSAYKDKPAWQRLVNKAFGYDFSWQRAAAEYLRLYRRICQTASCR